MAPVNSTNKWPETRYPRASGGKRISKERFYFPLGAPVSCGLVQHKGCPEFPVSLSLLTAGELVYALGHPLPCAGTSAQRAELVAGHPASPGSQHPWDTGFQSSLPAPGCGSAGGDTHLSVN